MLLTKGMKLLVADDARALLFEVEGGPALHLLGQRTAQPVADFADQPGQVTDRATGHGTAFPQGDPERVARERFAPAVVGFVGAHLEGARLVVVAPPRMLAALRALWSDAVLAQIAAEVDKTLTGHPVPELIRVLSAALDPV